MSNPQLQFKLNTPIQLPPLLTRDFVSRCRETVFLVGTDRGRHYHIGESKDFQRLQNVFFIPVKLKPCMDVSSFYEDYLLEVYKDHLNEEFDWFRKHIQPSFANVVPDPMLAKSDWAGPMHKRSPKCYAALQEALNSVCSPWEVNYRFVV
jgi:hypothetical protein